MIELALGLVLLAVDKVVANRQLFDRLFKFDPQFLGDLAAHRPEHGFALLDAATGERPFVFAVTVRTPEQELIVIVDDDGANFLAELEAALIEICCHTGRLEPAG